MHKYFVKLPCKSYYYMKEGWELKHINTKCISLSFHVTAKNKACAFDMAYNFAHIFSNLCEGDFEIKIYSGEKVDYSITKGSYKVFIDEKSFTTTERDSEENE